MEAIMIIGSRRSVLNRVILVGGCFLMVLGGCESPSLVASYGSSRGALSPSELRVPNNFLIAKARVAGVHLIKEGSRQWTLSAGGDYVLEFIPYIYEIELTNVSMLFGDIEKLARVRLLTSDLRDIQPGLEVFLSAIVGRGVDPEVMGWEVDASDLCSYYFDLPQRLTYEQALAVDKAADICKS